MSFTFDGLQAELDYRQGRLLAEADRSRLAQLVRRGRAGADEGRGEQVRDGTEPRAYDLAA